MRSNLRLLALLALSACPALGVAGTLTGRVVDPDGKAVQRLDSEITVIDANGKTFAGRMDRDGNYRIAGLPAGPYSLDLDLPTRLYDRYARSGVEIAATGTVNLDLHLEWGMNLGTVGDDPLLQGSDLRAKTKDIDGPVPRMPDGTPDLSGIWTNFGDSLAGAAPMKPWAQKLYDAWRQIKQDNPGAYCLPQSGLITLTNYPYKFVQTPTLVVQLVEDMVISHRQIHLDGRGHPPAEEWNPSWYGHSIGRWEGDTLVVETVGFNDKTPGFGIHTEGLKITEKYRRTSRGRMEIEITAEDPEAWTGPWTRKKVAGLVEGIEIAESVCAEGHPAQSATRAAWKARP
jgi:hypothetical protein